MQETPETFAEWETISGTTKSIEAIVPQSEEWELLFTNGNNATRAGCFHVVEVYASQSATRQTYLHTYQQKKKTDYCTKQYSDVRLLPGMKLKLTMRDCTASDYVGLGYWIIRRRYHG